MLRLVVDCWLRLRDPEAFCLLLPIANLLFQGLGTKNFQSVLAGFVYFYSYQYLKDWYIKRSGVKRIGMGANLLIAAAAGAINSIVIQVSKYLDGAHQSRDIQSIWMEQVEVVFCMRECELMMCPFDKKLVTSTDMMAAAFILALKGGNSDIVESSF